MTAGAALASVFAPGSRALLVALLLLLCAFLMPAVDLPHDTYDYIVVFDITQSMNVEDYELEGTRVSRLYFARAAVRRALRDLPCGSRVGWGVFAEYRTLLLLAPIEVCRHYNDLLASLANIDGRMRWGNASEVAKGVLWSIRMAKDAGSKPSVLFLTDGQEAPPLGSGDHPVFGDVKAGEIRGWLIGVGGYAPKPIPKTDAEGNLVGVWRAEDVIQRGNADSQSHEHLSGLREPYLQALARQVGFDYARLAELSSIGDAMRDARFAHRKPVPTDIDWLPTALALIVLVLRFRPPFSLCAAALRRSPIRRILAAHCRPRR